MKTWYRIANKKTSAEIDIYGEIGWEVTAKSFAEEIKALGKKDKLEVFINSPGGDVFDGVAVYNILKRNPAEVITNVDGMALSIASVIAMAGDKVNMAENAIMMIHNPWGFSIGDAAEMRKMADALDKVRETAILPAYRRTGQSDEVLLNMMDEETWLSAEDAEEWGFIDAQTEEQKMAAFDLAKYKYKNMPVSIIGEKREEGPKAPAATPRLDAWRKRLGKSWPMPA